MSDRGSVGVSSKLRKWLTCRPILVAILHQEMSTYISSFSWSDIKTNVFNKLIMNNLMSKSEYCKSIGLNIYTLMRCSKRTLCWSLHSSALLSVCQSFLSLLLHLFMLSTVCVPSVKVVSAIFAITYIKCIHSMPDMCFRMIFKKILHSQHLLSCKSYFACCLSGSDWGQTFELLKYPSKCYNIGHTLWLFKE